MSAARTGRQSTLNKRIALAALRRSDDALTVYDDVLARFGTTTELPLHQQMAKALLNKGVTSLARSGAARTPITSL